MYRPQRFRGCRRTRTCHEDIAQCGFQRKQSHAYIFRWVLRGTGKRVLPRLSKAINCLNSTDGEPCNECHICKGITQGTNSDMIEIDAVR